MIIERASLEDAGEILALQKLAYLSEAAIYDDYGLPPLTQTTEQMADDFAKQLFLKATIDSRIVGSVRAYAEDGTCYVGRLIAHPEFRNRGIGTRLMEEIERCFSETARYELFTGHRSEGNLRLYNRLGYSAFAEKPVNDRLTLVFLEKKNQSVS